MSRLWKVVLTLGLVLPVAAFVAGSLAASSADEPAPRETILIQDASPSSSPTTRPSPTPTGRPSPTGSGDDRGDRPPRVVTPEPNRADGGGSGRGSGGDDGDDDRDDRDDDGDDDRDDDDRGGDDDD
ncbi:hypothetical protein [Nocardioides lijunqiniae]|uniref:hypothetical protein n=1 Tax=Nocardioides lijunqiniae TaxID=2760832 RepID=UPI001878D080|nr:hypothetical protein [Nocardioides lijunqiniae]